MLRLHSKTQKRNCFMKLQELMMMKKLLLGLMIWLH
jgi:hypothetical protein